MGDGNAQPPGGSGGLQPPSAAVGNSSAPPTPAARTPPAAIPPPAAAPAPAPAAVPPSATPPLGDGTNPAPPASLPPPRPPLEGVDPPSPPALLPRPLPAPPVYPPPGGANSTVPPPPLPLYPPSPSAPAGSGSPGGSSNSSGTGSPPVPPPVAPLTPSTGAAGPPSAGGAPLPPSPAPPAPGPTCLERLTVAADLSPRALQEVAFARADLLAARLVSAQVVSYYITLSYRLARADGGPAADCDTLRAAFADAMAAAAFMDPELDGSALSRWACAYDSSAGPANASAPVASPAEAPGGGAMACPLSATLGSVAVSLKVAAPKAAVAVNATAVGAALASVLATRSLLIRLCLPDGSAARVSAVDVQLELRSDGAGACVPLDAAAAQGLQQALIARSLGLLESAPAAPPPASPPELGLSLDTLQTASISPGSGSDSNASAPGELNPGDVPFSGAEPSPAPDSSRSGIPFWVWVVVAACSVLLLTGCFVLGGAVRRRRSRTAYEIRQEEIAARVRSATAARTAVVASPQTDPGDHEAALAAAAAAATAGAAASAAAARRASGLGAAGAPAGTESVVASRDVSVHLQAGAYGNRPGSGRPSGETARSANVSVRNSANIIPGGDASSEAEAHPAGTPQQGGGTPGAGVPVPAVAASGPLALLRSATARAAAASRPQSASSPQHLFGASESGAELTAVAAAAVAAAPTGANTGSGAAAAGSPHRSGVRKSQTFNGPAILRRQAADPGPDPSSPRRSDTGGELLLPQPSGGPNGADGGLAAAAAMARASPASRRRASLAAVPERVSLAPDMDPAWTARAPSSRRAYLVLPGPGGVLGAAPAQQPQRPLLSPKAAFLALSGAGAGAGAKDGAKEGPWEEGVARRAQSMSAAMMAGAQLRQLARPPSSAFTPPLPPPGPVDAAAAGPSHSSRQAWVDPAAPEPMSSGGGWAAQHSGPLASAPGHLLVAQAGEDAPAGLWQRRTQMPPPMASPSRLGLGLGGRRSTATNDASVRGGNNSDALPSGPLPSGPLPSGPLPSGALSPVASGAGHVGHLGDAAGISSSSPQLPHIFIGDASADRAASSTGRRSSVLGMLGALSRSLRHAGTSLSGAQRAGSGRRASSVAVTPLPPGTAAVAPAADPHSGSGEASPTASGASSAARALLMGPPSAAPSSRNLQPLATLSPLPMPSFTRRRASSAVDPPVLVGAEAPAAAAAASAGPATAPGSGPEDSSVRGPPSRPGSRAQLPLLSSPLASSARWSSIFKRSSLGPEPTASPPAAEPLVLGGPAPASQSDLPPGPPPPPPPPPSPPPRSGRVLGMAMTPHTEAPAAALPLPAAGGGHGDANVGGGAGGGAARGVSIGFSAKGGGTTAEVERAFMLDTEASGVAAVARQGTQDALLETFLPPPPSGSGYARAASELASLCSSAGRTARKQSGMQEAAAAAAGGRGAGGDGTGGAGGGTEQLPRRSGSGAAGVGLGSTGTSSGWPASPRRQAALLLDSTPGGHGLPYMSYNPRPMSGLGVVPLEVSMLRLQGLADTLAAMTVKREAGVTPRKHDE